MSLKCGISGRKNGGVSKKKKKGHRLPVDSICVIGGAIVGSVAKFQKVFAGRTECSRGPHVARGP